MGAHGGTFTRGASCRYCCRCSCCCRRRRRRCSYSRTRTTAGRHGVATRSRHRVVFSRAPKSAGGLFVGVFRLSLSLSLRLPPFFLPYALSPPLLSHSLTRSLARARETRRRRRRRLFPAVPPPPDRLLAA